MNWGCLGLALLFWTISVSLGFAFDRAFILQNMDSALPATNLILSSVDYLQSSLDLVLWAAVDCAHMMITLVEVLNLKASRIEDNALGSSLLYTH
jgi:hypothetical protein